MPTCLILCGERGQCAWLESRSDLPASKNSLPSEESSVLICKMGMVTPFTVLWRLNEIVHKNAWYIEAHAQKEVSVLPLFPFPSAQRRSLCLGLGCPLNGRKPPCSCLFAWTFICSCIYFCLCVHCYYQNSLPPRSGLFLLVFQLLEFKSKLSSRKSVLTNPTQFNCCFVSYFRKFKYFVPLIRMCRFVIMRYVDHLWNFFPFLFFRIWCPSRAAGVKRTPAAADIPFCRCKPAVACFFAGTLEPCAWTKPTSFKTGVQMLVRMN